jgi:alkylation response protein AidB-like acyl-CoA dehydrogenase
MDFSLSDEQAMLADSIRRFIDTDYLFETRQKIAAGERGFSDEMWRTFADLGWTAVPFAEADGGLDGGPVELMLMMEQFGRGLVVEPFLANIVLAGGVLKRVASAGQKERWLAPLIAGELQAALAFAEPQGRYDIENVSTTAERVADGYVLNGRKAFVLNGGAADLLIIPARVSTDAAQRGDAGPIGLFAVPAETDGLEIRSYPTADALQAAEVRLQAVSVPADHALGDTGGGFDAFRAAVDDATLAVCAEAVGIMQCMHDKTVDYSKNRVQFGVPIGTFQALQHRMVDTMIACEQTRSLLYWCVMLNAAGSPGARDAIGALKYQVGTAGTQVAREAVQLHGGMGVTWELDIAHYFKRLTAIDLSFGNADYHLDRFAGVAG